MKKQEEHTYPDKILPTVRSDMMAYHKHGYTFDEYVDRNTHGRNYGKELYPIWEETLAEFNQQQEDVKHDGISENPCDEGFGQTRKNRGRG